MSAETTWAEEEFGAAQMGDVRRTHRLVELAEVLGAQPHASLPQATEDAAQLKATYRFFDAPCTVLLDDAEWKGLYGRIHRVSIVPAKPPSLREVVRWIGQLGGFQGRRGDGEPGIQALSRISTTATRSTCRWWCGRIARN
ncbi:IS4/Tn5 family transposase DNA-binding protein [Candidatus Viridilinea mediisalina]|uniref:Transposase Tn5-like N-terminal domain-containing protein n=1 Tax=Candidatus Viridilinea mediisalina TaxID=2024553 RepID=A0A2A6RFS5_9CHLR|nr:transposase DNA-binding-containing protein [Candidatus Viridilinea mediisalina]PDW01710.1 hypothetical protein CJ255_17790 [Candidatus Viridilinea mediisalina]